MKREKIEADFFRGNRKNICNEMQEDSVAFFFAHDELWRNGDQYYPYRQNSNFYYLSGIGQAGCVLVLRKQKRCLQSFLFIPRADPKHEIWFGHRLNKEEAGEISGIRKIFVKEKFERMRKKLLKNAKVIYLDRLDDENFAAGISYAGQSFFNALPAPAKKKIRSVKPLIEKYRTHKQDVELRLMKKAVDITRESFENVLKKIKHFRTEYEVEAELLYHFHRQGAVAAFGSIVAGGLNATVLHYVENNDELLPGDLLLLDFGAEYNNYAADCSRTIPVNGKFSPRQKAVYEAVLRVQEAMIKEYVPGNTINKLNEKAGKLMEKELLALGLLTAEEIEKQDKKNPAYKKYFMHGLAHFLGLDVHDAGNKETVFRKGMVLTCEPGIYIREEKTGIRIEDDILVDNPPVNLTKNIPKKISELEKFIAANAKP